MAKKNGEIDRLEKLKNETKAAQVQLGKTKDELNEERKAKKRVEREVQKVEATQEQLTKMIRPQASAGIQIGLDVGSTVGAQAINELVNLGVRALAERGKKASEKDGKSPKESFWYRNVDVFQSTGGAVGTAMYIIEMITRPDFAKDKEGKVLTDKDGKPIPYIKTMPRQVASDLGKILQNLGLHNLLRTLRYRYREDVDEQLVADAQMEAAQAEIAALRKRLGE